MLHQMKLKRELFDKIKNDTKLLIQTNRLKENKRGVSWILQYKKWLKS